MAIDYDLLEFSKPPPKRKQKNRTAANNRKWQKSANKKRDELIGICPKCKRPGMFLQGTHIKSKKMGGTSNPDIHDPEKNQKMLCAFCHMEEDHGIKMKDSQPQWSKR